MSSPPNPKRFKTTVPASAPSHLVPQQQIHSFPGVLSPFDGVPLPQAPMQSGSNPRKRRSSPHLGSTASMAAPVSTGLVQDPNVASVADTGPAPKKKGRTNTPWTAEEEQRLKSMRDAGRSWSEIAKTFPARTEGSVKKHWYKDMHYAEFAEDESVALREAIKEYEANKWKAIGQKVGKPAKACEQYAKEHFKSV
ncbi:SANT/Myb-like DNA-binding domain-containing protein [Aspergillus glaucus CBS 516.65]|uniref:Myb-like domain-containing protein n=1 Tax=Aspergillus glaucus CBS 516.65 TaxID=1160497 RepID=A0A1L9VSL3_ASPGL|nr:hypothetical protein ASPGLDRAFT_1099348 [Aspergillus glaucus CBS 516.65]OJJ86895.1 hypothetical protein ASPGLDRAFT_1099348 [Aspergillus glaucus CBS 516.65]